MFHGFHLNYGLAGLCEGAYGRHYLGAASMITMGLVATGQNFGSCIKKLNLIMTSLEWMIWI